MVSLSGELTVPRETGAFVDLLQGLSRTALPNIDDLGNPAR